MKLEGEIHEGEDLREVLVAMLELRGQKGETRGAGERRKWG